MAVSTHRCHFSLTSFSVSLLCNLILSAYSKADTYISHESESFMILWPWMNFFNHITNFRKGCPMWLFKVLLRSLVFFVCTPPVSWASLVLPATAAVKTCFTCKEIKTSDPPEELLVLFIFCSFKYWHLNTVVAAAVQTTFSLIFLRPSLLQKIQWGFKITFSKTMEECPEVLGCCISESSVEDFRRSIFLVKCC